MIAICRTVHLESIPERYLAYGPDTVNFDDLALVVGKQYAVYARRKSVRRKAEWYFVRTENGYLWWMPAVAFEVTDDARPSHWSEQRDDNGDSLDSFPSLHDWKIEQGIIDGDKLATDAYFAEASKDRSFPSTEEIATLNSGLNKQLELKEYERKYTIAKQNGWELPEKPEE